MNGFLILLICIPSTSLVIYLAFLNEENRLLKNIYKKISLLNPDKCKRVLISSSKPMRAVEIIKILMAVTGKATTIGGLKNGQRSYKKIEELVYLYAKKEGVTTTLGNLNNKNRIGCLRDINKTLDIIANKIEVF